MDQKLKNYSSGMQVRLAFSIAIQAQTEILLLDEVLAVGDARFQRKCYDYFLKLKKEGRTVVLVTHDMGAVQRFCDRALVIEGGKITGIYNPYDAAEEYEKINQPLKKDDSIDNSLRRGSGEVVLQHYTVNKKKIRLEQTIKAVQGKPFSFTAHLDNKQSLEYVIGVAFYDQYGVNMAGPNTSKHNFSNNSVTFSVDALSFNPGIYTLMFVIYDKKQSMEYDYVEKSLKIEVEDVGYRTHGKINMYETWSAK